MFAENLKKLRKEKGLSQEEIAAKLNVVGRTYGSWERNEREPDFSTLCKIADFFNVSTDYILGRVPMNIEVKKETPPDLPEGMRDIQLVIPDNASPEAKAPHSRQFRAIWATKKPCARAAQCFKSLGSGQQLI